MYENTTRQDDWKTQHNNYIAQSIIELGPELCKEYNERNYTERHSHSKTATALGAIIGNPSAWVHDAFYSSMNIARTLVEEKDLDPKLKKDLSATLLSDYYWVVATHK